MACELQDEVRALRELLKQQGFESFDMAIGALQKIMVKAKPETVSAEMVAMSMEPMYKYEETNPAFFLRYSWSITCDVSPDMCWPLEKVKLFAVTNT